MQVAHHLSGRSVETASGPGGAIVAVGPHRRTKPSKNAARESRRTAAVEYSEDEKIGRAPQQEEQEAAERVAAAVAKYRKLAWSLSASDPPALSRPDSLSPCRPTTPPSPSARDARHALASPNPFDSLRSPGTAVLQKKDKASQLEAAETKGRNGSRRRLIPSGSNGGQIGAETSGRGRGPRQ